MTNTLDVPGRHSYLTPKCEVRPSRTGSGGAAYAIAPIARGELVGMWSGVLMTLERLQSQPESHRRGVQVEEDLYLVCLHDDEGPDFINHSCEPNLGLSGQMALVAMRDIAAGEEVCFDYAMTDGAPYDEFDCECGAPACRGRITGQDWKRPELWEKYAGYFSPYLQRRIARLKEKG